MNDLSQVFLDIYHSNSWGSPESVSGPGSELAYTRGLVCALPGLFETWGIGRVFDAPCGDMNWMRSVIAATGIDYSGLDIVAPLIEGLQRAQAPDIRLAVGDIRSVPFPDADLWICRDCLFHLSYADIRAALHNFLASNIPYVLTSSHINTATFANNDIVSGGFRLIDLFAAPFSFPAPALAAIDDWIAPWPPRRLYLWRREALQGALTLALK